MKILNDLPFGTFDLHIHTTASDGDFTPAEVVVKAKLAEISTIAITDHDTLAGIAEAREIADKLRIRVISGVEITTRWQGKNIDILGYNIENGDQLQQALSPFREARLTRAEGIVARFTELGMPLTMDDVKQQSGDGIIARPHIAKAIVAKGYVTTIQEAFNRYLADGKPAALDKKRVSTAAGIKMIHQAGGVAVLAHPVYIKETTLIEEIIQQGLDGIEVWHRNHQKEDVEAFLEIAKKHRLLITGGSDFHVEEHRLGQFMAE
jgi:3',5'-nucleoside bisphosphate phosphatase